MLHHTETAAAPRHWSLRRSRLRCAAAASPVQQAHSGAPPLEEAPLLACPVCLGPLSRFRCATCDRQYAQRTDYVDLTLVGSSTTRAYNERTPRSQSMFEQPSISWLYERGWRSSFAWAGFPGEQAEFDLALGYMSKLPSSASDSVLVDLSCGSGLFTRRFSASRRFGRVLGLDFSAAMLEEARRGGVDQAVALVRADAGRLPLLSGSVDVVHAGAAIHCWPSPLSAFAEVSRVLKPGGVFVASTFQDPVSGYLGQALGDATVLPFAQQGPIDFSRLNSFRWFNEAELRDLAQMAGLVAFERTRDRQFIMFACRKPAAEAVPAVAPGTPPGGEAGRARDEVPIAEEDLGADQEA